MTTNPNFILILPATSECCGITFTTTEDWYEHWMSTAH